MSPTSQSSAACDACGQIGEHSSLCPLEAIYDLVRDLGSRWREGDMKGAGKALAALEDAVGLREQGR